MELWVIVISGIVFAITVAVALGLCIYYYAKVLLGIFKDT